jgi:putative transposase
MRTLKEECLWLKEWSCPSKLIKELEDWIASDNEHYLHSALGYKTPRQFEREYYHSHSPPFVAA